jgi:chemotaxis family two-component system response regulator Rcp1
MSMSSISDPILLVEDSENDILITKRAWKKGHIKNPLHIVNDGEEAISFLRREGRHSEAPAPSLILLDLKMPRMDGFEVLSEIKKDQRTKSIPVIVLTSSNRSSDIDRAYELGCNSYIVKPVNFEKFINAIVGLSHYWLEICTIPSYAPTGMY